jgi:hypothetical protein
MERVRTGASACFGGRQLPHPLRKGAKGCGTHRFAPPSHPAWTCASDTLSPACQTQCGKLLCATRHTGWRTAPRIGAQFRSSLSESACRRPAVPPRRFGTRRPDPRTDIGLRLLVRYRAAGSEMLGLLRACLCSRTTFHSLRRRCWRSRARAQYRGLMSWTMSLTPAAQ